MVTVADRAAEQLIRRLIAARFPDHAIVGEEFGGDTRRTASHRWIIDPIDGTNTFVRGVPFYGVLIALEIDGVPKVGVAYFPALDEMVAAATGLGLPLEWPRRPRVWRSLARRRDRRLHRCSATCRRGSATDGTG